MASERFRYIPRLPSNFTYISRCVKYTLFFFNLLFWLIGGAIIGIGGWSYLQEYSDGAGNVSINNAFSLVLNISLVVIIAGSFIFIISFFGCLGALRENICLLKMYSFILLLLFVGELIVATLAFTFPDRFADLAKEGLSKDPILKYRDDVNLQNFIDIIQQEFSCCGISQRGYRDWSENVYFECKENNQSPEKCGVPFSCCRDPRNIDSSAEAYSRVFTRGCIEALEEFAKKNLHIIAGVLLSLAFIQLFAMYLCRTLLGQIEAQRSRWSH